jgi:hypothetical protein
MQLKQHFLHGTAPETLDRRVAPEARHQIMAGFARWPGDDHQVNCG